MRPSAPPRITDRIPGRGEVWIDARIIAQLKLELGASLRIGAGSFRVTQVLDYRPDQGTGFVNLAPAALLNYDDVAVDAADPAGQPGHAMRRCSPVPGGGRGFPRILGADQGAGRAPAGCRRIQPAIEFRHRPRQSISRISPASPRCCWRRWRWSWARGATRRVTSMPWP